MLNVNRKWTCTFYHVTFDFYIHCLEYAFVQLIPEYSGWLIENDKLKPIPYERDYLSTLAEHDQADLSSTYADDVSGYENEEDD